MNTRQDQAVFEQTENKRLGVLLICRLVILLEFADVERVWNAPGKR